jgi:hypothetical protein
MSMRAIEAYGVVESDGRIRLLKPAMSAGQKVKIIILIREEDEFDDEEWIQAAAQSGSFEFLNDPGEDIYSKQDGKPVAHEV